MSKVEDNLSIKFQYVIEKVEEMGKKLDKVINGFNRADKDISLIKAENLVLRKDIDHAFSKIRILESRLLSTFVYIVVSVIGIVGFLVKYIFFN